MYSKKYLNITKCSDKSLSFFIVGMYVVNNNELNN